MKLCRKTAPTLAECRELRIKTTIRRANAGKDKGKVTLPTLRFMQGDTHENVLGKKG